jgi:hypothetical protein
MTLDYSFKNAITGAIGAAAVILAFRFLPSGAAEPASAAIVAFLTSLQSRPKE